MSDPLGFSTANAIISEKAAKLSHRMIFYHQFWYNINRYFALLTLAIADEIPQNQYREQPRASHFPVQKRQY